MLVVAGFLVFPMIWSLCLLEDGTVWRKESALTAGSMIWTLAAILSLVRSGWLSWVMYALV